MIFYLIVFYDHFKNTNFHANKGKDLTSSYDAKKLHIHMKMVGHFFFFKPLKILPETFKNLKILPETQEIPCHDCGKVRLVSISTRNGRLNRFGDDQLCSQLLPVPYSLFPNLWLCRVKRDSQERRWVFFLQMLVFPCISLLPTGSVLVPSFSTSAACSSQWTCPYQCLAPLGGRGPSPRFLKEKNLMLFGEQQNCLSPQVADTHWCKSKSKFSQIAFRSN